MPTLRFVAETRSTNADLLDALRSQARTGERVVEGAWLVADRQSAGKGRQGRDWSDGAGNFMGSTVVQLAERDPPPATLALVAGLAVFEAAIRVLADPGIAKLKWPNDLLLDGAKAAGILLQREGDAIVVGIGVNLASSPDLPDRPTAAFADYGPAPDRDTFAHMLAECFATELERWRTYGLEPIVSRWQAAAIAPGTPIEVHEPDGRRMAGAFAGLAADGSMQLRLADGTQRAIHAGDVMLA